jgi:hypothetical protein
MGLDNERVVELDANHHSICKFAPDSRNYGRVIARFEAIRSKMMEEESVIEANTIADTSRAGQIRGPEEDSEETQNMLAMLKDLAPPQADMH